MIRALLSILSMLAMTACYTPRLFQEDPPLTKVDYVEDVCEKTGTNSQACLDASRQTALHCFRTIGTVDCYVSEDPFGNNDTGRFFVTPIDGKPLTPSPG